MQHRSDTLFDLIGAITSGLCTGFIIAWTRNSDGIYVYDSAKCLILAVSSYVVVTLLLSIQKELHAKVPKWVLIALLGTIIVYGSIILIPNEIDYWKFREEASLIKYALVRLKDVILNFLGFSIIIGLIALLVMGTIHYISIAFRHSSSKQGSIAKIIS